MLLSQLVRHAEDRPHDTALCEAASGRRLAWRELRDAAAMLARDLGPESDAGPLLVVASNCLELPVSLLAGLARGGTVVPLSPELPPRQLREIAQRVRARTAIGIDAALDALDDTIGLRRIALRDVLANTPHEAFPLAESALGSLVLATSGTTGAPKLIRRSAAALDAVGIGTAARVGVRCADRMLLAIPLHHSYGVDQGLLTAVIAGATVELHDGFSLSRVHAALRDGSVTILPAVPYMLDVLARSGVPGPPPAALRRVLSAGGPLPYPVFEEFSARFGVRPGQIYGATEFGSVTYSDPDASDFEPLCAGRPFAGVEIRIADPDAPDAAALPDGSEGQVLIAGPSLLAERLDDATPPLRDGFFPTGDLGRLDDRGRLWITGRLSLLVDVGGRKVNPIEVEAVLEAHPAVATAAVIPIPYSRTVERLKAIVVPAGAGEPSPAELRDFLLDRLAPYKIPRSFEIRRSLPRSPTGKLVRHQLIAATSTSGE